MTNVKLVRRLRRVNKDIVGHRYKYFPRAVTRVEKLPVGRDVTVLTEPEGEKGYEMVEVCLSWSYRSNIQMDDDKKFHVFVGDLAK